MEIMGQALSSSWFWDRAMSGVIGSVISGLVTLLVLWITLDHSSRQRDQDALRSEIMNLRVEMERLLWLLMRNDPGAMVASISLPTNRVASMAHRRYPALTEAVHGCATLVARGVTGHSDGQTVEFADSQLAIDAIGNCKNQLDGWLADPKKYRREMTPEMARSMFDYAWYRPSERHDTPDGGDTQPSPPVT